MGSKRSGGDHQGPNVGAKQARIVDDGKTRRTDFKQWYFGYRWLLLFLHFDSLIQLNSICILVPMNLSCIMHNSEATLFEVICD